MTNEYDDRILTKIRNLFNKAQSVAGTPEADAFNAKAFEMLAKFGIDEQVAKGKKIDGNIEDDKMLSTTFTFKGTYDRERLNLLWAIAGSMSCAGLRQAPGELKLFGLARHIRRVRLIHSYLAPQMLAGASKANPENPLARNGVVTGYRRAWMSGFADAVSIKIAQVEAAAIRQADRNAGDTSVAVARASDQERAIRAMHKKHPNTRAGSTTRRGNTGAGYRAGAAAGSTADVGQARMGSGSQNQLT